MGPLARQAVVANRRFLAISRNPPPDHPALVPEVRNDVAWRLARRDVYTAFGNFAEAFYRMMREPESRRLNVPQLNDLLVQNHMLAAQISTLSTLLPVLGSLQHHPQALTQLLDDLTLQLQQAEALLDRLPTGRPQQTPKVAAASLASTALPQYLGIDALPSISRALEARLPKAAEPTEDPAAPRFELAHLTYDLRQMIRIIERIRDDAAILASSASAAPPETPRPPNYDRPPEAAAT